MFDEPATFSNADIIAAISEVRALMQDLPVCKCCLPERESVSIDEFVPGGTPPESAEEKRKRSVILPLLQKNKDDRVTFTAKCAVLYPESGLPESPTGKANSKGVFEDESSRIWFIEWADNPYSGPRMVAGHKYLVENAIVDQIYNDRNSLTFRSSTTVTDLSPNNEASFMESFK